MEQLTKNQAVATSQEAVQNQNEPQLRDENAHNDKSVHGVLNPTYQAGLRRDAVQPDIEAERKKRDEIEAGKSYCSRRFGGATCDDKSAQIYARLMLVLNLPFKALMFLTLMRPSLVLFLVLWLKLVKDFLKVRCRLALLPFLISCLIWLDLVASLPLIKERILVIILLLHFLSLMLGSVLVLMLPLLVWLTPDLRIKKSLLKCNWTIRKRLPRCKMRLKKRLLAFSRRLHARIRKTRYMHKMRCLLINRRSLLLALRLLWKTPIFPSNSRFPRLCAKCLLKLKRLVSILPMTKSKK